MTADVMEASGNAGCFNLKSLVMEITFQVPRSVTIRMLIGIGVLFFLSLTKTTFSLNVMDTPFAADKNTRERLLLDVINSE